ncbi:MAG: TetR/AcrR family transcriptional regulator [Alphaproteobacteria bacterium]|nr:TetR/AcrR family transcriptional regulator [Alphaproteobacteria bacterium]
MGRVRERAAGKAGRPGRPADRAKHDGILEAATGLFLERGYRATSMDRIAASAGVSKITIYAHFSSKAALFAAIVEGLAGRLTAAIRRLALSGLPPEEALRQVGRAYLRLALAPSSLGLHRLLVAETARDPALGRLIHRSGPRPIVATLADYLSSRKELRLENPPLAAEQFLGMVLGHAQIGLLFAALPEAETRAAIDGMVDHAVELFLTGARRRPD